jgi:tRNA(fMet)-specific endonuclease VapC
MATVVVDTDVVSFLVKHDSRAQLYRPHLHGNLLLISFMTLAELDSWALRRNWGQQRRSSLERYLDGFTVHPVNRELCLPWAEVTDSARRSGRPIGCADAWIAATALIHGAPLVTHNARDYSGVDGLSLISEASK